MLIREGNKWHWQPFEVLAARLLTEAEAKQLDKEAYNKLVMEDNNGPAD